MKKVIKSIILGLVCFIVGVAMGNIATTKSKEEKEVKEIITETREDFYIEKGDIGIIFTNDSWAVYDKELKKINSSDDEEVHTSSSITELKLDTMAEDTVNQELERKSWLINENLKVGLVPYQRN